MCPGALVKGGGGGSGGGSGNGAGSGDGAGGGGEGGGEGTGGDGRTAASGCTREGEPVDVATGSVVHERLDFQLSGVFSLRWLCTYLSSSCRHNDAGLGHGWSHSFAHRIELGRRHLVLTEADGSLQRLRIPAVGERHHQAFGRFVSRRSDEEFSIEFRKEALTRQFQRVPGGPASVYSLVRVADGRGQAIELRYDAQGRLAALRDTVGRELTLTRDDRGRILRVEGPGPDGRSRVVLARYGYDEHDNQVSAVDPRGAQRTYEYDQHHRLTAWTNRTGARVAYLYEDGRERCRETWCALLEPSGIGSSVPRRMKSPTGEVPIRGMHHRIFDYSGGRTEAYDTYSAARRYEPNTAGTVDKTISAAGGVVTQTRDRHGQLLRLVDARESVREWKYDQEGRIVEQTDPLGRTTRFEWGDSLVAKRIAAPNGAIWTIDHTDAATRVLDPLGSMVEYHYDERGLAVATTRDGREVLRARRGGHAQVEELTQAGRQTRFEYDHWGRRTAVISADGGRTTFAYDLADNLVARRDPAGREARYEYDGEGRLIRVYAPDGTTRTASYNGLGWLLSVTNAAGETSRLHYDWEGQVVEAVDPRGETHAFAYTLEQYLREVRFPDGRVESYRYDLGGYCVRVLSNGRLLCDRTFDAVGNLVAEEHEDGSIDQFQFDALDFMVEAKNPSATVRFSRDVCGNVLSEEHEVAGMRVAVRSQPGADGVRVEREVGGASVRLAQYDGMVTGRWLDEELQQLRHDAMGRVVQVSRRAGLTIDCAFNSIGLLSHQRATRPVAARVVDEHLTELARRASSVERTYEYTPHLELGRIMDVVRGDATDLAYDPFGRLLSAQGQLGSASLAHDASSNIVRLDSAQRVIGPGNRLERSGSVALGYDELGRVIEKRDVGSSAGDWWRYQWGPYGLREALHSSGKKVSFAYDALGRRVSKTVENGPCTVFVWDGNSLAQEIRDGVVHTTYVFEDNSPFFPVALKTRQAWYEVLTTPAGAPTELLGGDGRVAWSLETHPYGTALVEKAPGAVDCNLGFQGQYRDRETGLHYNRFRTYDPELGIYLEPDPIGVDGGLHPWTYARNPIGWIDPMGLANGAALEASMRAAGGPSCPPGFQAHHIISEELYSDPRYSSLLGNNAHQANNGIYLPESQGSYDAHRASGNLPQPPALTMHGGRHSSAYNNHIRTELDRINGLPPCQQQAELTQLRNNLGNQLQQGTFTGTSTSGRSVSGLNCRGNCTP